MGYEALCDLAVALDVSLKDIALNNRLSIAFGARGQGSAVAHYEPAREVINLTKMRGAGSLAHEWGHALDHITRQEKDKPTEAVAKVLAAMKYREATPEEKQAHAQKVKDRTERNFCGHLKSMIPESRLTEQQLQEYKKMLQEIIENPSPEAAEQLSDFKKQALGHVITKDDRWTLSLLLRQLQGYKERSLDFDLKVETEFYKSAQKLDKLCSKCDKGYWSSDVELFARAFACYVSDKLAEKGGRSDYLCGHCESCVTYEMDKNGEMTLVKGFPEGEERKLIDESFDQLIREYKELGYLHEPEMEKEKDQTKDQPEPKEPPTDMETENQQYTLNL